MEYIERNATSAGPSKDVFLRKHVSQATTHVLCALNTDQNQGVHWFGVLIELAIVRDARFAGSSGHEYKSTQRGFLTVHIYDSSSLAHLVMDRIDVIARAIQRVAAGPNVTPQRSVARHVFANGPKQKDSHSCGPLVCHWITEVTKRPLLEPHIATTMPDVISIRERLALAVLSNPTADMT